MSIFRKTGRRCDWCGKFSMHRTGEYTKPDGISCGYMHAPEWDRDGSADICEECAAGRCPKCGGAEVVNITPAIPGPDGWGGRCKACGHRWEMVAP
jgi:hypothetical protein